VYFDGREWHDLYMEEWHSEKALYDHQIAQTAKASVSSVAPPVKQRINRRRRARLAAQARAKSAAGGPVTPSAGAVLVTEPVEEREKRWPKRYGEEVVRLHAELKEAIVEGLRAEEGHCLWRARW
jgi:hypothetical protein